MRDENEGKIKKDKQRRTKGTRRRKGRGEKKKELDQEY